MTWEIPGLEFLRNNDLFLRVAFITYLLRCWLHGNLGYSIICCIETEQLDLFLSVREGQNLSKFKTENLKMLFKIWILSFIKHFLFKDYIRNPMSGVRYNFVSQLHKTCHSSQPGNFCVSL